MNTEIPEADIREQAKRDSVTHFSTGLAVVRDNKILLVRRAKHDTFGGCFELPGGGVEDSETILDGANRELKEETGLTIATVVSVFEGYDYTSKDKAHVRLINFLVTVEPGEVVLDPNEHDAFIWIDAASDIDHIKTFPNMKRSILSALSRIELAHRHYTLNSVERGVRLENPAMG